MKRMYEVKNISDSVKDISGRRVKVAISHFGSKDLDDDIIMPGAFTKTISERGPKAANLIWHLTDHNPSLKSAVGKFTELNVEGDYRDWETDRKSTRLNSSHSAKSRMPSSA